MLEMLTLRVDKWLREGSGVGLLLLLVAQEKVCPWLLMPPPPGVQRWCAASAPAADACKRSEKRTKPTLPCILPDAPAPRWPAGWSQTTIRQTTGVRDGVLTCGQKDRSHAPRA